MILPKFESAVKKRLRPRDLKPTAVEGIIGVCLQEAARFFSWSLLLCWVIKYSSVANRSCPAWFFDMYQGAHTAPENFVIVGYQNSHC